MVLFSFLKKSGLYTILGGTIHQDPVQVSTHKALILVDSRLQRISRLMQNLHTFRVPYENDTFATADQKNNNYCGQSNHYSASARFFTQD